MNLTKKQKGFNLVELMVVLAIVAIIAAVALPSYRDSIIKSKRQLGKAALIEVLGRQEQNFVNNKSYTTDLTNLGYPANGFYIDDEGDAQAEAAGSIYLIQLADGASATSFTLQAVPQGGQTEDDTCGTLAVTDAGVQSPNSCWN